MGTRRRIKALSMPDVTPAVISTKMPEMRLVSPGDLYVDEGYQRDLSERSIRLIRKIVEQWDWRAYKPPIVADNGGWLEVIDGQHTAIAAVSHGGIDALRVMVVEATERSERAHAFVRHNRDRVIVTATQTHAALVEAGDEDALTIKNVCDRAGVKILKNPPQFARFKPGETLAIAAIRSLVSRRHGRKSREVLEVCVAAGMAPVSAAAIKAVDLLLNGDEYRGDIKADVIAAVLQANAGSIDNEAKRFAAERKVPVWRALASVIFMNRRRRRRVA